MNGLLFLFYCIEILGALLCGAQSTTGPSSSDSSIETQTLESSSIQASQTPSMADLTSVASSTAEAATQSPTTVSPVSSSHNTSPSPGPKGFMFYRKECIPVFMVTGGLIIACSILLVSTLLLLWKVCQLNRRIKMLSSNTDLISTNEYWMGTAKKNKSKSETEVKETTVLMSEIPETQEEMGNGTTTEEEGKVSEDGQTGEENKKEEVEDTAKSEEASTTPVAENASSSKSREEATDSQSDKAVAASSSKGIEEPKDVV